MITDDPVYIPTLDEIDRMAGAFQAATDEGVEIAFVDRAIPESGPPTRPRLVASTSRSSSCQKPRRASSSFPSAGAEPARGPGERSLWERIAERVERSFARATRFRRLVKMTRDIRS